MSPFALYQKERFGLETIEEDGAFLVYGFKSPALSIEDIFVPQEKRALGLGKKLFEEVRKKGIEAGLTLIWTQVQVHSQTCTLALTVALKEGFQVLAANERSIILTREIGD